MSLEGFKTIMGNLRTVLIQDACLLINMYPDCPVWEHPLFQTDQFKRYQQEVLLVCKNEAANPAFKLQIAIPEVANAINTMNHNILGELLVLDHNMKRLEEKRFEDIGVLKQTLVSSVVEAVSRIQFIPTVAGSDGTASHQSTGTSSYLNSRTTANPCLPATQSVQLVGSNQQLQPLPLYTMSRQNHNSVKDLHT